VPELANTIMRDLPRLGDTEAISRDRHLSGTNQTSGQLSGGGSLAKLVHAVKRFMWAPLNGRFNHVASLLQQIWHVGAFLK
jgi:hypothetical protein